MAWSVPLTLLSPTAFEGCPAASCKGDETKSQPLNTVVVTDAFMVVVPASDISSPIPFTGPAGSTVP